MGQESASPDLAVLLRTAAECRAAARRVRIAVYEANPAWAVYDEAGRHEGVAALAGIPPAISLARSEDGTLEFCARFHSPLGATEYRGRLGGRRAAVVLTCNTHGAHETLDEVVGPRRSAWAHQSPLPAKPLGGHLAVTRTAVDGPEPTGRKGELLQFLEPDFDVLVAVLEGALLAMAEFLDFEVHARSSSGGPAALELSLDAVDTLEMLWKLKATDQQRAVSVKRVSATNMRRRQSRRESSTYVKAAERGASELKASGLLVARPRVGTWLNLAGVAVARDRFSRESSP